MVDAKVSVKTGWLGGVVSLYRVPLSTPLERLVTHHLPLCAFRRHRARTASTGQDDLEQRANATSQPGRGAGLLLVRSERRRPTLFSACSTHRGPSHISTSASPITVDSYSSDPLVYHSSLQPLARILPPLSPRRTIWNPIDAARRVANLSPFQKC